MDWPAVEQIIGRLEACTDGRATELPANAEILAVVTFLGRHLPAEDARYAALVQMAAAPTLRVDGCLVGELRSLYERLVERAQYDAAGREPGEHSPNRIPLAERQRNLLFAGLLLAYGTFAGWQDDFLVPLGRRGGIHLHGSPLWVLEAATLCAVAVLLLVIVDHYDRRPNERIYEEVGRGFRSLGWVLFGLALLAQLVSFLFR